MFKVLTYVDGLLTVINGDKYFSGVSEKPDFIIGETFYYEPTLKQMDGVDLSKELIENSDTFINNFIFDDIKNNIVEEEIIIEEEITKKYYVDIIGNYYGESLLENLIEVPYPPNNDLEKIWDFKKNQYFEAVVIDEFTNTISNIMVISKDSKNLYYGYKSNFDSTLCNACQIYNKETCSFNVDISIMKNSRTNFLYSESANEIQIINKEISSNLNPQHIHWYRQEMEAVEWKKDNTYPTIFIDNILIGRNLNENKEEFINKILLKADNYKKITGKIIGKLSIKIKELEEATSVEQIKNITW